VGRPSGLVSCRLDQGLTLVGISYQQRPDTEVEALRHTWFERPIALADQPYIDQTYRYGSTMGGNFQQHQGVEFNNPDGTPVHASPVDSVALIVDPNERYPRYTVNPELWIRPLPGTGIVAGQVWDAQGRPVPQARVYGLMKAEPQETPFSYAETYGEHNHPD